MSDSRIGMGPLVQLGWLGFEVPNPKLTVAVHGGDELDRNIASAFSGELGLTYRFGPEPGLGIHTGITAEGVAAATAARAAQLASDPAVQLLQHTIAADEHRHAELAWAFLDWATAQAGDEVRAALHAVHDIETAPPPLSVASAGLERHGRLGAAAVDAIARAHCATSRARLSKLTESSGRPCT